MRELIAAILLDHDKSCFEQNEMSIYKYALVLPMILVALVGSLLEMRNALEEEDLAKFSLWVSVGAVVSGLPIVL
jgi:hypothetical protein